MRKTLAEIAKIIQGEVVGDKSVIITGLNGIKEARQGDLSFVANSKYFTFAKTTQASALIVSRDFEISEKPAIRTNNPSLAFAKIVTSLAEEESFTFKGIHQLAYVDQTAQLGKNVHVGPFAIVEPHVKIGDDSIIFGGCYIRHHAHIGKQCRLYPHVTILDHMIIGNRVILHSGCVIGADGFGYEQVEGEHEKIPQVGIVRIEDDVEIGACTTIDRARFQETLIGKGTKIDNLVQIGHNCQIGKNCIIIAQVGISGSTVVEDNCIIAGQGGLAGHITIGEGSIISAQAGVTKSLPPKSRVQGYPADEHMHFKRIHAHVQELPSYAKTIKELLKRIEILEKRMEDGS